MALPTFEGALNHPALVKRRRLYSRLCELASAGAPCPINAELAPVAGYGSASGVQHALYDLTDEGLIVITRRSNQRRVTICATGQSTAEPASWAPAPYTYTPKRTVRDIAAAAIAMSGRPAKDILGRSRFKEHVRVRQVIVDFAMREGWGACHVARVIGFDHSTINYARRALPKHVAREPETASFIAALAIELPPLAERCIA